MGVRLGLFIQALFTFIIGLYLSSQGVPSITETGNQILDTLDDVNNNPQIHKITENTKSSINILGSFIAIASFLELIALGISLFVRNGGGRI